MDKQDKTLQYTVQLEYYTYAPFDMPPAEIVKELAKRLGIEVLSDGTINTPKNVRVIFEPSTDGLEQRLKANGVI